MHDSIVTSESSLFLDTVDKVSVDPECSLGLVDAHALWKRFLAALVAEVGEAAARLLLASVPHGPLRAIPACLDRVALPGWRFRSVLEAEAASMPDAFEAGPALQSTQARPGSAQKLAALSERAERGEDLWHPDDAVLRPEIGERSSRSSAFYSMHAADPPRSTALEDLIDQSQECD